MQSNVIEFFNIGSLVDLTRISYHMSHGLVSIRSEKDFIEIIDDEINGVSIRIFMPNSEEEEKASSISSKCSIFYYHGGAFFIGSAG